MITKKQRRNISNTLQKIERKTKKKKWDKTKVKIIENEPLEHKEKEYIFDVKKKIINKLT